VRVWRDGHLNTRFGLLGDRDGGGVEFGHRVGRRPYLSALSERFVQSQPESLGFMRSRSGI